MKRPDSADSNEAPRATCNLSIDRRGFLIRGAAVIVGATGIVTRAWASTASPGTNDNPISVGYWIDSDTIVVSDPSDIASASNVVISATSLPSNAELLQSRGATVRVHGLFGAPIGTDAQRLDVIAQYSLPAPAGDNPVYVWSHQTSSVPQSSPSAMFAMPMNAARGITLNTEVTSVPGSNGASQSGSLFNATATGVYFIALNVATALAWSSYVFTANPAASGARTLFQHGAGGMQSVPFPYLMISVAPIGIKTPLTY